MFICKFNRLGNIKMLECFLLRLSGIFCIYTRLVLCRSIEFFNTVVTVRNESRQILAYLMHFCSNHVILCDRLFAVLAIHLYQKVFWALPLVFFSIFFIMFQHRPALHLFQVSALCATFFVVVSSAVPWSLPYFTLWHFN